MNRYLMTDGDLLRDLTIDRITTPSEVEEIYYYYVDMDRAKPGFTLTLIRRMMTLALETEGKDGAN